MKLYIARDEDGYIAMYSKKPVKCRYVWKTDVSGQEMILPEDEFPEVSWEDKEPTEVELQIISKPLQK